MLVRGLMAGIFLAGLVASFVKPFGDFLEGRALLGGSLLSLVAFLLYDAIVDLRNTVDQRPVPSRVVTSDDLKGRVEAAFSGRKVEIRFLGYTGETLVRGVDECLRRLLSDRRDVESIDIRILIPDFRQRMAVPSLVGEDRRPIDDGTYRRRLEDKARDNEGMLKGAVEGLRSQGWPSERVLSCQYRVFHGFPRDKLVILNAESVLHGLYDVRTTRTMSGGTYYDPQGANTSMVEVARGKEGLQVGHGVDAWIKHFDGLWELASLPRWSESDPS
ncbi:hypothetical protein ACYSUO_33740 [Streptomyces sp. UC4497]